MATMRSEGPCPYGVLLGWAMRRSARPRRAPLYARLQSVFAIFV